MELSELREALDKFLFWIGGVEESSFYESTKRVEGFTDEEWEDVVAILYDFVDEEDEVDTA